VVLLIHEIFGLSDWAQELADQVAAAGYIAIAPDLLSGMAPNGGRTKDFPVGVTEAVSKLNPDQVTADLTAAADYGLKLPATNGKLYVAGFCWGGGQSFRFATIRGDLSAAFVFYGPPPTKDAMSHIKAPVYGFYGGNDARIDATAGRDEGISRKRSWSEQVFPAFPRIIAGFLVGVAGVRRFAGAHETVPGAIIPAGWSPKSFHEKAGRSQDGFVFLPVDPKLFTEPPLSPSFHPQSLLSDFRSLPPRYSTVPVSLVHQRLSFYASATLRMSFPVFSPLKSFSSVSGNISSPSTMCSRDLSLPAAIHAAISRAASG
jgi:pimeloyl-ACP methyl ester carboxylesterase